MKKIQTQFLLASIVFLSIATASCDGGLEKECTGNNREKVNNDCVCKDGFVEDENGNCVEKADDVSGNWKATEACTSAGNFSYTVTARDSSDGKHVIFTNFFETGEHTAWARTNNTFTLASGQKINSFPATGTGSYDKGTNTCSFDYQINSTVPDTCRVILKR